MNEAQTVDFFDRLEGELRAAAQRPRRRVPDLRAPATLVAVALAIAVALVPVIALLGSGPGERTRPDRPAADPSAPDDGGLPPADPVGVVIQRSGEPHTVVASGVAPVAGRWQMEAYGSTRLADPETGEVYQPAGLRCLGVFLLEPSPAAGAGQCGEFPQTPGFSRVQHTVRSTEGEAREILVYGRAPERASAVVLTADGGLQRKMEPLEGPPALPGDYYLFAVPADVSGGRVNWLDASGEPGGRGQELLPP